MEYPISVPCHIILWQVSIFGSRYLICDWSWWSVVIDMWQLTFVVDIDSCLRLTIEFHRLQNSNSKQQWLQLFFIYSWNIKYSILSSFTDCSIAGFPCSMHGFKVWPKTSSCWRALQRLHNFWSEEMHGGKWMEVIYVP